MDKAEPQPAAAFEPNAMALEAQQELVLQYTPLVKRIARALPLEIPGVLEYDDAVSYGFCGLVEAVRRFDAGKGTNFPAYAARRIRGSMIDAFRQMDRLSRTTRRKAREVQTAQMQLQLSLGRTPTESEVAGHLGLRIDEYRKITTNGSWVTVSLDRLVGGSDEGEGSTVGEARLADQDTDIARGFEEQEMLTALAECVRGLPEREHLVVSLYYVEQLTMKDIAAILNVSETRVSQLHAQALRRLRTSMLSTEAA